MDYEQPTPTDAPAKTAEFARSLRASMITPESRQRDGKTYPAIGMVFSKFWGQAKDMRADQWLDMMTRPISAGYKLKSVKAIVAPSRDVMRESWRTSRSVMDSIARQLEAVKKDFKQLDGFGAASVNTGVWKDEGWPRYAGLSYKHDVGANTKSGPEKLSDNWCLLYVSVTPISGNPRQQSVPTRLYPKLGARRRMVDQIGQPGAQREVQRDRQRRHEAI